jgi:histone acetyltransferase
MYKASSSPRQRLSRASSPTNEDLQPLAKRPRLSEEDDEDEDQPLALTARMNLPSSSRLENGARPQPSRRGGKGMSAMSTAHTAPVSIPPPSGDVMAEMNGDIPLQSLSEVAVKVEEQMDESQLDRLATGVTVDTADPSSSSSVRRAYQHLSHMESLTFPATVSRYETRETLRHRTTKGHYPNNTRRE